MKNTHIAGLTISALGIVYGDLGTSPLYAMNEVFFGAGNLSATTAHVTGVVSLIFWLLIVIVGVKYSSLVLRADHRGEGGTFALMSIVQQYTGRHIVPLAFLLMFASGLLFGDGIITPAISVLSAVEGLKVLAPGLGQFVIPLTLMILVGIFFFQKHGTRRVGKVYGPIMLIWFIAIALLGLNQIILAPAIILAALNPINAITLLFSLSWVKISLLIGAVFLVLTGSEALYADLGHFGTKAIRIGWFSIVFPSLALCYAGQGAYLLRGGEVQGGNLFYSIIPTQFLLPMIILATAAAIIASVALVFGSYSLVSQAIVLKLLPRMGIVHTNEETEGQIYIPAVNWALFVGSALLVLGFGSASKLAAAYGFAVAGVMVITSLTMFVVAIHDWHWSRWISLSVFGTFITIDIIFLIANSVKFSEGGYIPFLLACLMFAIIATWRSGRRLVHTAYHSFVGRHNMQWFLDLKKRLQDAGGILKDDAHIRRLVELDRAVVFLVSKPIVGPESQIPVKLRVYLKRKGAIPKNILILNIQQTTSPYIEKQYKILNLGVNVFAVHATFGFMENPDAHRVLQDLYQENIFEKKFRRCTIETSEDELIIDPRLPFLRKMHAQFFKFLQRWSVPAYRYFGLTGEASIGLSKTVVPIFLGVSCASVIEIPEFSLKKGDELCDPDLPEETSE